MGKIRFIKQLPLLAAAVVFMASIAISLVPVQKASAATGCTDNDRNFAETLARNNDFVEFGTTPTELGKVTLRYSSESGCAWGLFNTTGNTRTVDWGLFKAYVWLDRSWDGGSNWNGRLGESKTDAWNHNAHTGTYHMVNSNAVRACSTHWANGGWADTGKPPKSVNTPNLGAIVCTPWFFPGRMGSNQTMGGRGFSSLSSQNNRYVLRMQGDGNLVLYSWGRAVWAINKFVAGSIVKMQSDGNLVVIAPGNQPVWATNSNGPGAILILQDDGNIVLVAPGGRVIWASGTNGR